MKLPLTMLGLALGNVIYQALTGHDYARAFEISYFQGSALVCVWLINRKPKKSLRDIDFDEIDAKHKPLGRVAPGHPAYMRGIDD